MHDTLTDYGLLPLGATAIHQGVFFKVWAPNADGVAVTGSWNEWEEAGTPLEKSASGNWQVWLKEASDGDEYRYLITRGKQILSKIDPRAREVTSSVGNGVVRSDTFDWKDDAFTLDSHNRLVIYELHTLTFAADANAANPLEGVVARLDHLVKLGVNVIQIMPVAEFAGDLSWGYNPAHIFAVESSYGGPDALKKLVREAHQRGIGVVLDVVYNHFGPSDLDLWQFDGWNENDLGGIYFYNDWKSETPWGNTRPDYGRQEVRDFIHDNALMWIEEFHMDGLRYDMTLYMRSVRGDDDPAAELAEGWSLAQDINNKIREKYPDKILIAEDLRNVSALTTPAGDGGAAFHTQWDAGFVHPVCDNLIKREDGWRKMQEVGDALLNRYNDDVFERVVYTESHDEVANGKARVPQEINPDDPLGYHAQKRSCLGAVLVLTAPGVPMLFQGQEFLQGGWFRDDVPLDWHLGEEFSGTVRLYRDLIALRRNLKGVSRGLTGQGINIHHLNEAENVLVYHRWSEQGPGDDVVVVINLSHTAKQDYRIGFPAPGLWKLRLNSDATIYSPNFENTAVGDVMATQKEADQLPASGTVAMGPYSALIFSQETK